jgi:hypothetical protein
MFARCIIDKSPEGVREKVKRLKPDWEPMDTYMRRLIGTPQEWIEKLHAYKDKGVEYFLIDFPERTDLQSMKIFAEEVMPALR